MPPLWKGQRRGQLLALVALGIGQGCSALGMALLVDSLLSPGTGAVPPQLGMLLILLAVLGLGIMRWYERVTAEKLGQGYVHEQRQRLLTQALGKRTTSSLGVTVTRASNDLTAVRNWIALGIVPLVAGIPLILTVLGALLARNPIKGLIIACPFMLVLLMFPTLSQLTYRASRTLRRARGRMSARYADTVMARLSVRASGAVQRERNALSRASHKVVDAAVARSRITGFTRAATSSVAPLATALVVGMGVVGYMSLTEVAASMTLLGVVATPMTDVGRAIEYRQNYRAAARILTPLLQEADTADRQEAEREAHWDNAVRQPFLWQGEALAAPTLPGHRTVGSRQGFLARPGSKIHLRSDSTDYASTALYHLLLPPAPDTVYYRGRDLYSIPLKERRTHFGFASATVPLERGSLTRLVGYRLPAAQPAEVEEMIERVGLLPALRTLDKTPALTLKNGGSPLEASDIALVKIARALLGNPPVLLLDRIDTDLTQESRDRLHALLAGYRGILIFTSDRPELYGAPQEIWEIDQEPGQNRHRSSEADEGDDE